MQFYLLGPLEAEAGGVPLDLGPPKQRLIIAALLLARGRVVPLQELVESAWPEDPPASASASLQVYVSRIRSVLRQVSPRSVSLIRQPPGYRLADAAMDLDDFERLSDEASAGAREGQWEKAHESATAALSLWRGPLLADLPDDPWVLRERRRADERMERCVEVLVTALLGLGRATEALEEARLLRDLQPLRDQAVWLFMLALHRCARSVEALDVYRVHAKRLDEELGLEPVQELRDLQTAILREDPVLAAWPNEERAAPDGFKAPSAAELNVIGTPAVRLVGRSDTMMEIERWLDGISAGAPRWLLLTGAGGIGKTRLAEELVRRFQSRAGRIAWTTCLQDDGVPSWWPLRPLVRQLGGDPDEIFRIPVDVHADATRFVIYDKLVELLHRAAAEKPVVAVIDDLQWLDPASARAIAHLLQTLRDVPVGVVITLRDGPCAAEVRGVLTAFARHSAATHIQVTALDEIGIADLLGELAGGPVPGSEAASLARQTGGNPLLLTEYARIPRAERAAGAIPLAVREVLSRRFGAFDPDAMRVLHVAAVAGDGFDPSLLAPATGSSMSHVIDVLDAAARESIIVPSREKAGYQFGHGLLREHLLGELSPVRRQAIHAALAAAIALRDGADEDVLRRAQHLSAAMPVASSATVVAACREAAEYAESVWDWEVAARHWSAARTALGARRSGSKGDLYDEFSVAEVAALARAGQGRTLLRVVDDALRDASALRNSRTAARLSSALLRSSGAWPWTAYGDGAAAVLDRLGSASDLNRADMAAQISLLGVRAVGECYSPDLRIPENLSRRALAMAEQLGDPDAMADALLGRALTIAGVASCSDEVVTLLDRLEGLPHRQASIDTVLRDNILTMTRFSLGDLAAAEDHLRLAISGSDALRLPVTRVQLRWVEVSLTHWRGDLDRAEELARQAREHHEQTELYGAEDTFLAAYLAILWDRGALSGATSEIRRSADPRIWAAAAAAEADDRPLGRRLIRDVMNPAGAPADATDSALPVGRRLLPVHAAAGRSQYWYTLSNLCILAHAVADLEITEAAAPVLELLLGDVGYLAGNGQTAPIGPVSLPVGRLQALLGDITAAEKSYADAAHAASATGAGPIMMRVRAAQAELLSAGESRTRELAAVAHEAHRVGLIALAKRARRLAGRL